MKEALSVQSVIEAVESDEVYCNDIGWRVSEAGAGGWGASDILTP